jgi:hypothetical protein
MFVIYIKAKYNTHTHMHTCIAHKNQKIFFFTSFHVHLISFKLELDFSLKNKERRCLNFKSFSKGIFFLFCEKIPV